MTTKEIGWNDGILYEKCLRCGELGIASYKANQHPDLKIEMIKYAWNAAGTHIGRFRCKDRKSCESRHRKKKRSGEI